MPAAYAHYTFGKKVFQKLPAALRKLIGASPLHKKLFAIGLQGPDILFFYRPFCKNRINTTGSRIHQEPAALYFEEARKALGDPVSTELLSYLLGFVCHFVLDSQCHPYIAKRMTEVKVTHHEIESEFDRMLMEKDGRNPFTFNPTVYASPNKELCAVISSAYTGISPKKIRSALQGMIVVRDLMTGRSVPKRALMRGVTRLTPLDGLSLPTVPNARCIRSNKEMKWLYDAAVREGVELAQAFYRLAYNGGPLPQRFQRNFE